MKTKKAAHGIYSVVDPATPWKLPRLDWESPRYFYTKTASEWKALLQKASQGDPEAEFNVATLYADGCKDRRGRILVRVSSRKAVEWYRRAAEHGSVSAQNNIGVILGGSYGVRRNARQALIWLKRAYRGGGTASNNIAITYRESGNLPQAVRWFRIAIAAGDHGDLVQLGIHHYWGKGVRRDPAAAVRFFRKGIRKIDASYFEREDAFFYLGIAYLEGNGVKKSLTLGRKYLELANRENDHLAAQRLLKRMGRGI
jgi:hypothetical protein